MSYVKSQRSRTKRNRKLNKGKKTVCWKGYHRVKGTEPYAKKSCVKNKSTLKM